MFHLIVGFGGPDVAGRPVDVIASRYLEHTDSETQSRYHDLNHSSITAIKQYPAIFMDEGDEEEAFVARITHLQEVGKNYRVEYQVIPGMERLAAGSIQRYALELDIHPFEFHRSHWAIKDVDLFAVLMANDVVNAEVARTAESLVHGAQAPENVPGESGQAFNDKQIFIVHGHDEHAKNDANAYVESIQREPIILHLQASEGRTIIEKIDYYSNVGFAIVLYTECDVGAKRDTTSYRWRARQNVVFEHGYLIGKLGRSRVVALVKGNVETPNDISGVVYIAMDSNEVWKSELNNELCAAGYEIT